MSQDPFIGQDLDGRYRIVDRLGEGAMGSVYRARHLWLERDVAIKILLQSRDVQPRARRRLHREARVVARISHSNVVQVHDYGEAGGSPYLVMELVAGRTPTLLRRSTRLDDIVAAAVGLLDGLGAAHAAGVLHRDLKPANMMLRDGDPARPVLLDFGIAGVLQAEAAATLERMVVRDALELGDAALTRAGTVVGTPLYMAPEQALGRPTSERSDLYAMGVILFEWLAARPPFRGQVTEVMRAHVITPPPRLRAKPGLSLPPSLADVVLRALEKNPAERHPDAASMRDALVEAAGRALAELRPATQPDVLAVAAPSPTGSLFVRDAPFTGRSGELAQLVGLLESARDVGGVVRVVSADGLGRSRLVAEGLRTLGGCRLGRTVVTAVGGPPLHAIRAATSDLLSLGGLDASSRGDALRRAGLEAGLDEIEVDEVVAGFLRPTASDDNRATWWNHNGLQRLLRGLAVRAPVVLWLDDLHLADPEEAVFLAGLAAALRLEPASICVVVSGRGDAGADSRLHRVEGRGLTTVRLEPMPSVDLQALVSAAAQLPPQEARRVAARADGSPAFALALAQHVERIPASQPTNSLPESLSELMAQRLASARAGRPELEPLVEAAAVLGQLFDVPALVEVLVAAGAELGADAVDEGLDLLVERGLFVELAGRDDRLAWGHRLLREQVLQEAWRGRRRRRLALAAAERLAASTEPSLAPARVELLLLAGDPRAPEVALPAGRHARAVGLLDAAERYFELAAGSAQAEVRQAALLEWGGLANHLGRFEEAEAHHRRLAAEAADVLTAARAASGLGRALYNRGRLREALGELDAAAEAFAQHGVAAAADWSRALRTRASAAARLGVPVPEPDGAALLASASIPEQRAEHHVTLALVALLRGEPDRAAASFRAALSDLEPRDRHPDAADVLCDLGRAERQRGRLPEAETALREGLLLARRLGLARSEAELANELGELARGQGRTSDAREHYARAERIWGALGHPSALLAKLNLALVAVDSGRYERARELLASLRAAHPELPAGLEVPFLLTAALAAAGCGVDEAARVSLARATELLEGRPLPADVPGVLADLAALWQRRGATEALRALRESRERLNLAG